MTLHRILHRISRLKESYGLQFESVLCPSPAVRLGANYTTYRAFSLFIYKTVIPVLEAYGGDSTG